MVLDNICHYSYSLSSKELTVHRIAWYLINILTMLTVPWACLISCKDGWDLFEQMNRFGATIIATLFKPILLCFSWATTPLRKWTRIYKKNFSFPGYKPCWNTVFKRLQTKHLQATREHVYNNVLHWEHKLLRASLTIFSLHQALWLVVFFFSALKFNHFVNAHNSTTYF